MLPLISSPSLSPSPSVSAELGSVPSIISSPLLSPSPSASRVIGPAPCVYSPVEEARGGTGSLATALRLAEKVARSARPLRALGALLASAPLRGCSFDFIMLCYLTRCDYIGSSFRVQGRVLLSSLLAATVDSFVF